MIATETASSGGTNMGLKAVLLRRVMRAGIVLVLAVTPLLTISAPAYG